MMKKNKKEFNPLSLEHVEKSMENMKKEDGYSDYLEVLKRLGDK